jgi:hypothetical protein
MDGHSDGRTTKYDIPTLADKVRVSIPKPRKIFYKPITPQCLETVESKQTGRIKSTVFWVVTPRSSETS